METAQNPQTGQQEIARALRLARAAAALCLSLASPPADAELHSLVDWQDPFWEGYAFSASFSGAESAAQNTVSTLLQGGYGWENGFAAGLELPVVLADSPPTLAGAQAPRIGGAASGRIQLDTYYRFWGDARDYVAVEVSAGLPFQSDPAFQNSSSNSWFFPVTLSGRIDGNWIALLLSVTDGITTPSSHESGGVRTELDLTNSVSAGATLRFYPFRNYSPFIGYTEQFPSAYEVGLNQDNLHAFLLSSSSIGRVRSVSVGLSAAPFGRGWVLSVSAGYALLYPLDSPAPIGISGGLRWVF